MIKSRYMSLCRGEIDLKGHRRAALEHSLLCHTVHPPSWSQWLDVHVMW